jgi:hypothetical protein
LQVYIYERKTNLLAKKINPIIKRGTNPEMNSGQVLPLGKESDEFCARGKGSSKDKRR